MIKIILYELQKRDEFGELETIKQATEDLDYLMRYANHYLTKYPESTIGISEDEYEVKNDKKEFVQHLKTICPTKDGNWS